MNTEERLDRRGKTIIKIFVINIVLVILLFAALIVTGLLPDTSFKPLADKLLDSLEKKESESYNDYLFDKDNEEFIDKEYNDGFITSRISIVNITHEYFEYCRTLIVSFIVANIIFIGFINSLLAVALTYVMEKIREYQNLENKEI